MCVAYAAPVLALPPPRTTPRPGPHWTIELRGDDLVSAPFRGPFIAAAIGDHSHALWLVKCILAPAVPSAGAFLRDRHVAMLKVLRLVGTEASVRHETGRSREPVRRSI